MELMEFYVTYSKYAMSIFGFTTVLGVIARFTYDNEEYCTLYQGAGLGMFATIIARTFVNEKMPDLKTLELESIRQLLVMEVESGQFLNAFLIIVGTIIAAVLIMTLIFICVEMCTNNEDLLPGNQKSLFFVGIAYALYSIVIILVYLL